MNIAQWNSRVFARLGQEKLLWEYRDILLQLMGVVIDFSTAAGDSLRLASLEHFNPFCRLIRSTPCGLARCRRCAEEHSPIVIEEKRLHTYCCHAGLMELSLPLYDKAGAFVGCMNSGQFRVAGGESFDEAQLREVARECEVDAAKVVELYRKSPLLSAEQLKGIGGYLEVIGRLITRTHDRLLFMEKVNTPDRVELICKYVEENYTHPITVGEVAKRFFMSPGYFLHLFRKEAGVSFMSYVTMFRISKACEMLAETELPVSEIALLCGFGGISQFNRSFRADTGTTPRDDRKNS